MPNDATVTQAFRPVLFLPVPEKQGNRPEGLRYKGHEIAFDSPAIALS
jgi:hypothetical protein